MYALKKIVILVLNLICCLILSLNAIVTFGFGSLLSVFMILSIGISKNDIKNSFKYVLDNMKKNATRISIELGDAIDSILNTK